jgi:hypothetical protein
MNAPKTSIPQLSQQIIKKCWNNAHNVTQEFTYLSQPCDSSGGIEATRLSKKIQSLQMLVDNVDANNVLMCI